MKENIYIKWQEKTPVRVKNRGIASLATSSVNSYKKIASVNNKYVWPNSFDSEMKEKFNTKKVWNL